jgi:pantetheine-phosphate adenylyltransferase
MTRTGVYPGTFDPPTLGHQDIIGRAARLVDRLVVGVGVNPAKNPLFTLEERMALVGAEVSVLTMPGLANIAVEPFSGLLVHFAKAQGAQLIIRGLRDVTDLSFESQMANMNGAMAPGIETVFLLADGATQAIAATHVRDIARMGGDAAPFVSPRVLAALRQKSAQSGPNNSR